MLKLLPWVSLLLLLGCGVAEQEVKVTIYPELTKLSEREEFGEYGFFSDMMGPVFADGSLYLPDYEQSRILRTDSDLTPNLQIGRAGEGPGELSWSGYMAHSQGRIFVDSPYARRLAVYDLAGSFLQWIPTGGTPVLTRYAVLDETLYLSSSGAEKPITAYDFDGQVQYRMGEMQFTETFSEQKARNMYHLSVHEKGDQPFLVAVGFTEPVIHTFSLDGKPLQSFSMAREPLLQPRIAFADEAREQDPEQRKSSYILISDINLKGNDLICLVTTNHPPYYFLRFEVKLNTISKVDAFRVNGPYRIDTFTVDDLGNLYVFNREKNSVCKFKLPDLWEES